MSQMRMSGEGPVQEGVVRAAFRVHVCSPELCEYALTKHIINLQRKPPARISHMGVERVGGVRNMGLRNLVCMENSSSPAHASYGPGRGGPLQYSWELWSGQDLPHL